jgi:hypothetical protein
MRVHVHVTDQLAGICNTHVMDLERYFSSVVVHAGAIAQHSHTKRPLAQVAIAGAHEHAETHMQAHATRQPLERRPRPDSFARGVEDQLQGAAAVPTEAQQEHDQAWRAEPADRHVYQRFLITL